MPPGLHLLLLYPITYIVFIVCHSLLSFFVNVINTHIHTVHILTIAIHISTQTFSTYLQHMHPLLYSNTRTYTTKTYSSLKTHFTIFILVHSILLCKYIETYTSLIHTFILDSLCFNG